MEDHAQLRHARTARGLSLNDMAAATHYTKSYLSLVERGEKPLTEAVLLAYERALGVDRRRFLAVTAAVGAHLPLVEVLPEHRANDQWQAIADDYGRDYLTQPPASVATALQHDLPSICDQLRRGRPFHDAAAKLCVVQAMVLASTGTPQDARRWYRLGAEFARYAANPTLEAWTRGRQAFRTGYDLGEPAEVIRLARHIPTVEAHLAAAQAHARLGDRVGASEALSLALRRADRTPAASVDSIFDLPPWRLMISSALVHARLFTPTATTRALDGLDRRQVPSRWLAQADLAVCLSRARSGDPGAASDAAGLVSSLPVDHQSLTLTRLVEEIRCTTVTR